MLWPLNFKTGVRSLGSLCNQYQRLWVLSSSRASAPVPITIKVDLQVVSLSNARAYSKDYSSHLTGKYMQKLLNKKRGKAKKNWYQSHLAAPLEPIGKKVKGPKLGITEAQQTRARQLAHVLYERITDIVASEELSPEIQEKQVFITEVRMHPNFQGINVVWDADRPDARRVEELLQSHAGKLRSLLISYHILGKIPPVTFVKNRRQSLADIDSLLKMADYGPDYTPSEPGVARDHFKLGHCQAQGNGSDSSDTLLKHMPSDSDTLLKHMPSDSDTLLKHMPSDTEGTASCRTGPKADDFSNLSDAANPSDIHKITSHLSAVPEETSTHSNAIDNCDPHLDENALEDNVLPDLPRMFHSEGLSYRTNVYGLPVDVLMKKIKAKKEKVKPGKDDMALVFESYSQRVRMKKLSMMATSTVKKKDTFKDSTKVKQKRLERDPEDFLKGTTNLPQ